MFNFNSLAAFATFVATRLPRLMDGGIHDGLEEGAKLIETEAKRAMGTYDYGWTPLDAETVARKANGDTPLVETGAMRDSIHHVVRHYAAEVGSDDPKFEFHELGTRTIPARPVLAEAAARMEPQVAHLIGRRTALAMEGNRVTVAAVPR